MEISERLINKKVDLFLDDGTDHFARKTCLILDVDVYFVVIHNLKRDVIEYIPLSRIVRIEELRGESNVH